MRNLQEIVLKASLVVVVFLASSTWAAAAQGGCGTASLTDQEVREFVAKARAGKGDLPKPFEKQRWMVNQRGCHYVYVEFGLPETPELINMITMNADGVVVYAHSGSASVQLECPQEALTKERLSTIVGNARELRTDLPPAFDQQSTRVDRLQCLYLYYEYALPEANDVYNVFTIDPLGALLDFSSHSSDSSVESRSDDD